jgi:hypothetical protein
MITYLLLSLAIAAGWWLRGLAAQARRGKDE